MPGPWTVEQASSEEVTKRMLLQFLQENGDPDFKARNKLNGEVAALCKRISKQSMAKMYNELNGGAPAGADKAASPAAQPFKFNASPAAADPSPTAAGGFKFGAPAQPASSGAAAPFSFSGGGAAAAAAPPPTFKFDFGASAAAPAKGRDANAAAASLEKMNMNAKSSGEVRRAETLEELSKEERTRVVRNACLDTVYHHSTFLYWCTAGSVAVLNHGACSHQLRPSFRRRSWKSSRNPPTRCRRSSRKR